MLSTETTPTLARLAQYSFNQTFSDFSTPEGESFDPATLSVETRVAIAHTNPIIAAGLASLIRESTNWDVLKLDARTWTPWDALAGKHVVLTDEDIFLRAERANQRLPTSRTAWSRLILISREPFTAESRVHPLSVDATINSNCTSRELLGVVVKMVAELSGRPHSSETKSVADATAFHPLHKLRAEDRIACTRSPCDRRKGGLAPLALCRVRDYIAAHYAEPVCVHQLATIAQLSPHHFAKAFKQSLGVPPHRYILLRRIRAAAELVRDTDRSFAEIGVTVGFSDQSHFSRAFIAATGERPSAFRRMHR